MFPSLEVDKLSVVTEERALQVGLEDWADLVEKVEQLVRSGVWAGPECEVVD